MTTISMIAAMAKNRVIGADNDMPWHLPADLKHFKQVTLGKPVIMGRKTYESIGKALPGRQNIILSSSGFVAEDAEVVKTLEEALSRCSDSPEVMIIGGGAIYQMCLPMADKLYLTQIELDVEGDTHFPDYQAHAHWQTLASETHLPDEKNRYSYTFETLIRKS